ncbi:hypothetical protein [Streptomyces sviceus]|uniref:hypothetical protein n=1 Tax=Streptomyces sviceus TaxID=285530 RepID=UPI0036A9C8CA
MLADWFVLHFGSELLIEGPSRYTEPAQRLVAMCSGVSFAGTAIAGFSLSWIFGLVSIAVAAKAIGVNGADHWRHWRNDWRRARRVPR